MKRPDRFPTVSPSRSLALALALALMLATPAAAHPGCGIVVDRDGVVYFAFGPAHAIYRVDPSGSATRWVGGTRTATVSPGADGTSPPPALVNPHHLHLDPDLGFFTASDDGRQVFRIGRDARAVAHYPPPGQAVSVRIGVGGDPVAFDTMGHVIAVVSRQGEFNQIVWLTPSGRIRILATADWGIVDGPAGAARIGNLHSSRFVIESDGSILFTDSGTAVRRLAPDGSIRTLAGGTQRIYRDATGGEAGFVSALGLDRDTDGSILVADAGARRIRRVTPAGAVTTVAGSGLSGHADGPATEATFDEPSGVAVGAKGTIHVLEILWKPDDRVYEARVRNIEPDGSVRTLTSVRAPAPTAR